MEIEVCSAEKSDLETSLNLHEEAFGNVLSKRRYLQTRDKFQERLEENRVLVAKVDGGFAGFAAYDWLNDYEQCDALRKYMVWHGETETDVLIPWLKSLGINGEIVIDTYESSEIPEIEITEKDMNFTDLAVVPKYMRKGIGTLLTKERIKIARQNEANSIFVSCWEGGNVSKMHSKLGFLPIIKIGPVYDDGNAVKIMTLPLSNSNLNTPELQNI